MYPKEIQSGFSFIVQRRVAAGLAAFGVLLVLQFLEIYVIIRNDANAGKVAALSDEVQALHRKLDAQIVKNDTESQALGNQLGTLKQSWETDLKKDRLAFNLSAPKNSNGQNVFLGHNAGIKLKGLELGDGENKDQGSLNTGVGQDTLGMLQRGSSNTAIGTAALGLTDNGSHNVAAGARALASNRTGSANVALGAAALYHDLSGSHNTGVGTSALNGLVDGTNNSALGRDSLFTLKSGSWNSAFGVDSLPGLEVGQGNSAFGGEAGYTDVTDFQHRLGSFNSWFGYQSGPASLKQVSNSIAIGYRAKNTESNQTVLGNPQTVETIIFGEVKVDGLCVGATCIDQASLKALLDAARH